MSELLLVGLGELAHGSRFLRGTLQEWIGHRDFPTTLVYADYSPSEHEREWVEEALDVDNEAAANRP